MRIFKTVIAKYFKHKALRLRIFFEFIEQNDYFVFLLYQNIAFGSFYFFEIDVFGLRQIRQSVADILPECGIDTFEQGNNIVPDFVARIYRFEV